MNLASALKAEISRVARKESRTETQALKKASAQYRADIAALKRRIAELERLVKRASKDVKKETIDAAPSDNVGKYRFSATGLAMHRKRLRLSAGDMGSILGVTDQSVYLYENGKTKPRAKVLLAIAALRKMGKKQAAEILESRRGG